MPFLWVPIRLECNQTVATVCQIIVCLFILFFFPPKAPNSIISAADAGHPPLRYSALDSGPWTPLARHAWHSCGAASGEVMKTAFLFYLRNMYFFLSLVLMYCICSIYTIITDNSSTFCCAEQIMENLL